MRTRVWQAAGAAAVVAGAGLVTWLVWPDDVDPRARVYTQSTACLLTPSGGVGGKDAAPVWAAMQEASATTRGKVQFLEVDGPQSADNAATYLNTLVLGRCDLILTVGDGPNTALSVIASAQPQQKFLRVGKGLTSANVSVVDTADFAEARRQIVEVVTERLRPA